MNGPKPGISDSSKGSRHALPGEIASGMEEVQSEGICTKVMTTSEFSTYWYS